MSVLLPMAGAYVAETRDVIIASVILLVPLPLVWWRFGGPAELIVCGVALACLAGLTHYMTTRHAEPRAASADR